MTVLEQSPGEEEILFLLRCAKNRVNDIIVVDEEIVADIDHQITEIIEKLEREFFIWSIKEECGQVI